MAYSAPEAPETSRKNRLALLIMTIPLASIEQLYGAARLSLPVVRQTMHFVYYLFAVGAILAQWLSC
jgi:hypothetical protein